MSASSCARARQALPLYLEHEADPAEALETAAHLVRCDGCAAEADRGREVTAALRNLADPAPPRDIAAGVMARLRRLREKSAPGGALKWSAVGALTGLLFLEGSLPTPVRETGLRLLARIGELIDLDFLYSRLIDSVSRFLPSPSSLFQGLAGAGSSPSALPALVAPDHAAALLLLSAAAVAVLSGLLIAGAAAIVRPSRSYVGRLFRLF